MININVEIFKKNTQILNVFFFAFLFLNSISSYSQAGIYDETDIEFQTMFIEAQLEKAKGNTDKQISLLKNVIKRDKSSHAAYHELAKAYIDLEEYDSAEKNAKKSHQFDSKNTYYLELLADIYERQDMFQKANETYKQLIGLDANAFLYFDKMAFNQVIIGEPKEAIKTLEYWQTQKGITKLASLKIFDLYNSLGQKEKALTTIENLSKEFPSNPDFLNKKANYLSFLGKHDLALNTYNQVLKINPYDQNALLAINNLNSNQTSNSSSINELNQLISNKNISLDVKIKELIPFMAKMPLSPADNEVLKSISLNLIETYPNEAKSFAVRGDVLFYLGEFVNSEKAYNNAIKLDDKKYLVWDQWILNLWELENYSKMESISLDALDFFPNQVNAYIYYAIASQKNKKSDQAIEMLEEATFIAGENTTYLNYINIVTNWINLDKYPEEQIAKSVSDINKEKISSALQFELLGDIYKSISKNNESKLFWENAIKLGGSSIRLNKKIGT